jgi:hypothetical protein
MKPRAPLLRTLAAALLLAAAGSALAQTTAAPPPPPMPPPKLEPLPEIPPPPGATTDAELEPQVTITRKEGDTVEEARVNGRIKWIRVTPKTGKPYYLVPDNSGNIYIRREAFDTELRVPLWVLLEF